MTYVCLKKRQMNRSLVGNANETRARLQTPHIWRHEARGVLLCFLDMLCPMHCIKTDDSERTRMRPWRRVYRSYTWLFLPLSTGFVSRSSNACLERNQTFHTIAWIGVSHRTRQGVPVRSPMFWRTRWKPMAKSRTQRERGRVLFQLSRRVGMLCPFWRLRQAIATDRGLNNETRCRLVSVRVSRALQMLPSCFQQRLYCHFRFLFALHSWFLEIKIRFGHYRRFQIIKSLSQNIKSLSQNIKNLFQNIKSLFQNIKSVATIRWKGNFCPNNCKTEVFVGWRRHVPPARQGFCDKVTQESGTKLTSVMVVV